MTAAALNPTSGSEPQLSACTLPISRAILNATLLVGALDAADSVVIRGLHGVNPDPSAAVHRERLVNGVIGHALFVGLPSAFFAKRLKAAA